MYKDESLGGNTLIKNNGHSHGKSQLIIIIKWEANEIEKWYFIENYLGPKRDMK